MSLLRIDLIGPPRIARDGSAVLFDTRKAVAMLALLAVRDEPQSRDTLAGLLWPEHDEGHAAGALRRTLSVLRAGTGPDAIVVSGRSVALDRSVGVDVWQLRAIAAAVQRHHPDGDLACERCVRRLGAVPDLLRGRLLEGFGLRDSPDFDDWLSVTAEAVDLEAADALDRLVAGLAGLDRHDEALAVARRRLALDPLHEVTHRRLMELHAQAGDRAGAIKRYRNCVRILDEELGVAPMPETTELYQRIAAHGGSPAAVKPEEPLPAGVPATGPLPLVGRGRELASLVAAWRDAPPGGSVVCLEGEPGIGKSRLLQELAAVVQGEGGRPLELIAHDGEHAIPYAPIVGAIQRCATDPEVRQRLAAQPAWVRGELARIVPDVDTTGLAPQGLIEGPGAEVRFAEAVSRSLMALLQGDVPGLLVVDDTHWADTATLDILKFSVRRDLSDRWCMVFARRPVEPDADRLADLLRDRRRGGRLVEVRPSRLTRDEVASLAAATGSELEGDRLYVDSEGIPFFVAEYLAASGSGRPTLGKDTPASIRELLEARFAGLSESTRQVLVAAAAIGRSFGLELVRATSGRSPDETARALEDLLSRRLITESGVRDGSPRYDFDHAKTREVAYASASLARRRLLHRRAAAALRGRGSDAGADRRSMASSIARHLRESGDEAAAARYLRIAADEAVAVFAHEEALELYRAAQALDPAAASALHLRIGDVSTRLGRYEEAVTAYEAAAASGESVEWEVEHRLAAVHGRRGAWRLAEAHLASALEKVPETDGPARARLVADRSLAYRRMGDRGRAAALATEALQLADAAGDSACRAQAHNLLGMLARDGGDFAEARRHLEQSLALSTAADLEEARIASLNNLSLLAVVAGEPGEAVKAARAALDGAVSIGDRHREAAVRNNLADALYAAGRRDGALDELKLAVGIFAEIGRPGGMEPEIWRLVDW